MKLAECHPNRKMQARGMCKSCYDKWLKTQNPDYKSSQISNTTKWLRANPEKRTEYAEKRKAREAADPMHARKRRSALLQRKYGITADDYDRMLAEQGGGCAICDRKPSDKPLHVDHCHTTNVVRGLLCHQCNWYIGTIDANPSILGKIKDYLS